MSRKPNAPSALDATRHQPARLIPPNNLPCDPSEVGDGAQLTEVECISPTFLARYSCGCAVLRVGHLEQLQRSLFCEGGELHARWVIDPTRANAHLWEGDLFS